MPKIKIGRHACVVIVSSRNKNKFLLSRYDDGYPVKIMFRGWGNLTGGANSKADSIQSSPEDVVRREISEEYSINQAKYELDMEHLADEMPMGFLKTLTKFAPEEDIRVIRKSILENLIAYEDFLVRIPGELFFQGKNKEQYQNIFSSFISIVPDQVIDIARKNLEAGRGLVNEGLIHLALVEELEKGFPLLAWGTCPILMHYTGREIPNLINAKGEPFGIPRANFSQYFNDFEYNSGFFKEF